MASRKTERVVPAAGRLVSSLRDLGYSPSEAVADLVDNSIEAGAHHVDITISFEGQDSWIRVSDDGRGMDSETIKEAMRYGASRDYEGEDLGRFGLGLKTASMSQCRRLTVASRTSKDVARIEARQLDLDFVEEHNEWDVIVLGAKERADALVAPLKNHRGTVVFWDDLDRILTYQDPGGGWARKRLLNLAEELELHLGMVFHRFLEGKVPRKKLAISINDQKVDAWDPFAQQEPKTETLKAVDVELNTPVGSGIVHIAPYVLPPKASFSSEAEWRRMSGPNNWNRQQGFYVYRANRLIQSGGWSGLRTQDEHTKLARVALMFSPDLDEAFGINVAKMRVSLPHELREMIEDMINKAARRARVVYDAKPDQPSPRRSQGKGSASVGAEDGTAAASTNSGGPTAKTRRRALEAAAKAADERPALGRIVDALEERAPEVAADLGY
jgi:hypothetical protein